MVGWWHIQKISWKAWTALTKIVLTTGYNEWQPAEKSSLVWERAENMPKWCSFCLQGMVDIRKDAMCGFQVSDCVCVCVSLCPYCQLMHLSMHHFCLSVWHRDNAEPLTKPLASLIVAPCSWPTLGEVNWGQFESLGKGIRPPNMLLSSLGFCSDARHLKSARD